MKKDKGSISIKQLATKLDLSPGTVSLVLNGRGKEMRISQATQERVQKAAQQLGYHSKISAKQLKQENDESQHLIITVFTPFLKGVKNVLGNIIYGIQSTLLEENLSVSIVMHPYYCGKLCDAKNYLSSMNTNGAIICGISDDDVAFLSKNDFNIPIVLFNRATEKYSSIYVDDYEAGIKVASLFNKRGHKNAGLIMPNSRNKACSMRQLGFMDGCKNLGIDICEHHIQKDELNIDGGYRAATRLLEHGDYPSALFILISEMAVGAVSAIKEKNIVIPNDIELVTYGDDQFEEFMTPSLSSIHIPVESIAAECLHLILEMIKTNDWRPICRIHPLTMVYRESCADLSVKDKTE